MDVTPQLLKDVDFREKKFGGYDPDEVDDFLERVGVAVGQLQMRLREATQRAEAAEARLAQVPPPVAPTDSDDTLRRTLLLAQRTADAAVQEAQEEADRLVAEAQEHHDRRLRESEDEVRRSVDETRERLLREIGELEGIRDQLMADVETLERHVDDQRARMASTVASLEGLLDAAGSMAPLPQPIVSEVIPPIEPEPDFSAPVPVDPAPSMEPEMTPEPMVAEPMIPEIPVIEPPPLDDYPPAPVFGEAMAAPAAGPETPPEWLPPVEPVQPVAAPSPPPPEAELFHQPPPPPPPPAAAAAAAAGDPSGFGGLAAPAPVPTGDPWADLPDGGPTTQSMEAIAADAGGDNPWMADLARDEIANQPPPSDDDPDAMAEWYRQQEQATAKPEKKRFGRKK